ncbi:MAG: hypothetical protein FWD79_07400 [Desulfobulbus sp.]|nr:hypothetical protein [Desulfobulbus sp.]
MTWLAQDDIVIGAAEDADVAGKLTGEAEVKLRPGLAQIGPSLIFRESLFDAERGAFFNAD